MDFLVAQFLTGLASASSLFLVASGLTLIFGVTRVVNFAHGSLYMLGAYIGYSLVTRLQPALGDGLGFWLGILGAVGAVALVGAAVESVLLRRIYGSPELYQLLATFGVVLIVADATLWLWGPADLLGPRAPGLKGAVDLGGSAVPAYDLALIALGPAVFALLWFLLRRTRWGVLVRAATADREMTAALGIDQRLLFTSVFALGAGLAGLAGALQLPRAPATLGMDLSIIVEAFVVTVVGGMGSLIGAFVAAVLIGELHAFGIVAFPEVTLVLVFLFMAIVLVLRPWGLFGKPELLAGHQAVAPAPMRPLPRHGIGIAAVIALLLVAAPLLLGPYAVAVLTEVVIFALFAASLHLLTGVGGIVSFGHAAYFGLGAYGAALAVRWFAVPIGAAIPAGVLLAAAGAALFGLFCVRLAGIYAAMLTLAFAQICYAVAFQWYGVTGGDNGLLGIWPPGWLAAPERLYLFVLAICGIGLIAIRRIALSPFGYGLRAGRDSALRAEATGIDVPRQQWLAFTLAGLGAGLAGSLHAFFKGSVFPESLGIGISVDGLVLMLLGGVGSLSGPPLGAAVYKTLHIGITSYTNYWRSILGLIIVLLVVAFPHGIAGTLGRASFRSREEA